MTPSSMQGLSDVLDHAWLTPWTTAVSPGRSLVGQCFHGVLAPGAENHRVQAEAEHGDTVVECLAAGFLLASRAEDPASAVLHCSRVPTLALLRGASTRRLLYGS
jgi:hypothetical protein